MERLGGHRGWPLPLSSACLPPSLSPSVAPCVRTVPAACAHPVTAGLGPRTRSTRLSFLLPKVCGPWEGVMARGHDRSRLRWTRANSRCSRTERGRHQVRLGLLVEDCQEYGPLGGLGALGLLLGCGSCRIGKGPEPRWRAQGVCAPWGQRGSGGGPRGCREATGRVRSLDGLHLSWLGGRRLHLFLPVGSASRNGDHEGSQLPVMVPSLLGRTLPVYRL